MSLPSALIIIFWVVGTGGSAIGAETAVGIEEPAPMETASFASWWLEDRLFLRSYWWLLFLSWSFKDWCWWGCRFGVPSQVYYNEHSRLIRYLADGIWIVYFRVCPFSLDPPSLIRKERRRGTLSSSSLLTLQLREMTDWHLTSAIIRNGWCITKIWPTWLGSQKARFWCSLDAEMFSWWVPVPMKKTDFQIFDFGDIRYTYTVYRIRYTSCCTDVLTTLQHMCDTHGFRFPLCTRINPPLVPSCSCSKSNHSTAYSYFCFPLTSYSTLLLATVPLCYTYLMTLHCMNEMKWSTEQLLSAAVASHCRW